MADYLVEHARKNVWCSPRMDHQVILQARRVSAPNGVSGSINLMWGRIPMPETGARFHVFQIGQIYAPLLGLLPLRRMWYRLSKAMIDNKMMADIYVATGLQLPRAETWILITEDRAILVATRDQSWLPAVRTESVYLRLYTNSYFSSPRADDDGIDHKINVVSHRFTNINGVLLFQQNYINHQSLPGLTTLFVNGEYRLRLQPQFIKAGDVIEFVYDSSVKQVLEFKLSESDVFDSTKDLKRKYLLTHGGDQVPGSMIDYRDDIDVYVIRRSTVGSSQQPQFRGVFYHKNRDDSLRMVTHRDYSATVQYVAGFLNDHEFLGSEDDAIIRLHIRHSGYERPVIFEHHRIHELYKLPYQDRRMAMIGTESTVDVWKAASLEASEYTQIMDSTWPQVTRALVETAYGYNGVAKVMADTPIRIEINNGVRHAHIPYGLQFGSTVYEFDGDGLLLGWFYWAGGSHYHPYYAQTELVEVIKGRAGYSIGTVFGQDTQVTLKDNVNYRFYITPKDGSGARLNDWMDVTGDETRYVVINGVVHWTVSDISYGTAIKSDENILGYRLQMAAQDGLLKFSIDGAAIYPNAPQGVAGIPPAKLDLWLNGHALIEDLDYQVKWPEIVVVNKEYLNAGDQQEIVVRGYGFCRPDMTREPVPEYGFVKWGLLSKNRRFNVRDDRVLRMVVRGATIHRDELVFSEDDSGIRLPDAMNGSPYLIDEVIYPIGDLVTEDFFEYREQSQVVDGQIEDYLTLKLPEPDEDNPNMIPNKYWLVSPFSSVVMHHLQLGYISMDGFRGQYSDRDVMERLADYEYLLEFEPTRQDLELDLVNVHPHNKFTVQQLDIYQYNFLNRAIKVFLDDKVDITQFIEIYDPLA